ncbi:MAG: hypothetical protein KatS3mg110_1186 [Pirellulaceae bacterium]|nr:MAG: hypothetical protein KatS3mg110_1186 [Pirellulaceae bacterium]
MDRFAVPKGPRADVELLRELDVWLESFRKASTSNSPARFQVALSAIESAIFDYCRYGRPEDLRNLFVALGKAERALAITCGRYQNRTICQPLANLSRRWVEATYDGSHEYHIAWALSRIGDTNAAEKVPFLRTHLEPVSWEKGRWNWQQNRGPEVVWQSADLATNMVNVLQRRIVGAANQSHPFLPIPSYRGASIHDIAAFLADGYCDDNRIEELLWALVLVDHRKRAHISSSPARVDDFPLVLPRQYALLKLLFLPGRLVAQPQNSGGPLWRLERQGDAGVVIKPEPRIIPLLLADRVAEACRLASARIRASGLCPMPSPMAGYPSRMADWEPPPHSYLDGRRLAASLLIPITDAALNQLVTMVVRPDEERDE